MHLPGVSAMVVDGGVMIYLKALQSHSPFADHELRRDLIAWLNEIPDAGLDPKNLAGWRSIPYTALPVPESRAAFSAAFGWVADLVRRG